MGYHGIKWESMGLKPVLLMFYKCS